SSTPTWRRTARRSRSRPRTRPRPRSSRRSAFSTRRSGVRATDGTSRYRPAVAGGAVDGLFGVVPNFSEGRRPDVIDAICRALRVPGAHLVFRQADRDHNRLDTTVLGDRDAVARAALSGARVAVALIDMERHTGGHPRMGAADVIPFMPVRG